MKKNYTAVILVLVTFFVISFITNILGPLFPSLVKDFDISLAVAGILPFSFFVAYGVMSIPSGILVDKYGERIVMIIAFFMAALGSFWFVSFPSFTMALGSLFLIGAGMAMLQVAINPLLRVAGGEENFAFYSVLAQLLFGGAATLSPIVYSSIVQRMGESQQTNSLIDLFNRIVPSNMQWLSMYWIFSVLSLIMLLLMIFIKLPKIQRKPVALTETWTVHKNLLKNRSVILFFIGIVAYVGTEQGVANMISIFLETHHQLDPLTVGASVVSNFWLLLTVGCVLGLLLLKLVDSRTVLKRFSLGAIISLTLAIFGDKTMAVYCFPFVGLFF
jgi:fucose permease